MEASLLQLVLGFAVAIVIVRIMARDRLAFFKLHREKKREQRNKQKPSIA
jgi:hypothetical protein